MIISNIQLGKNVNMELDAHINNIKIGDNVRIQSKVKMFGSEEFQLEIGSHCIVMLNCFIEGFNAKLIIGESCSIGNGVNIITGSGPNASNKMIKIFPVVRGAVTIGSHCWIGGFSTIMPNVTLGNYCVVAANSFVKSSFPDYSIVGGTPAKLIRTLTDEEIKKLHEND